MGKIILVTGGSRSGKSALAERIVEKLGGDSVLYIATALPLDEDMRERIQIHKKRRNPLWSTYEGYRNLGEVLKKTKKKVVLLDCVTVLITNILFEEELDFDKLDPKKISYLEAECRNEISKLTESARENDKTVVFVTNEVGMSLVPAYRLGRIFSDMTGKLNQELANMSDEVYMSVSGITLMLKPALRAVSNME